MNDDTTAAFSFPAVAKKKITAAFDGGRLTSDGGVMLLSLAERHLGIADRLARRIPDRRDPVRIAHSVVDMIRARIFAICCGYEDADDLDHLRADPAFKLACGRLPDTGRDLASQPTLSRLENAPRLVAGAGHQFGNGRAARTLWERTREAQSARVMRLGARDKTALTTIRAEDVAAAAFRSEIS
jgi:hypothetical protein